MPEPRIPIQPVEDPILCSPYKEPDRHWLYDTKTGRPSKVQARREASYWYKSERTGSAQRSLLTEEERDDLPLVNALRDDVRRWRKSGWQSASETTKKLLRHWWREDRARRLFFCQLEAAETIVYIREVLAAGRRPRWKPRLAPDEFRMLEAGRNPRPDEWVATVAQHPKLSDVPNEAGAAPIPRYACKMATGAGKTVVMSMLIAWAFCNRGTKPGDPRYPRRVLVVCPNLTIRERLGVLRPGAPGNYYEKFDVVPSSLRPELAKGKVLVTNWHVLSPEPDVIAVGGVPVGKLGDETPEAFARGRLGDLWDDEPLMVLNDEGHHAYRPAPVGEKTKLSSEEKADREEATVWVSGLDRINTACGIRLCVDLSATPFYLQGSGYPEGSPFPWIVSDFSLVDAIESGITKIPRLPAIDSTGRPDPVYFKQTIAFAIPVEIVRALTDAAHPGKERLRCESRRTLFPQVLRIVSDYIRERVDLNGLHPCDVGLQTYARRIVDLLVAAIVPDDSEDEAPLLPRLNRYRPIGSTGSVHFKTVKPVQATSASHLNHVACDTGTWEQAAAFRLEKLANDGIVHCYARNDHLEFNIPFELYGTPRAYEPDFIVKLANGLAVVLEIKGRSHDDTDVKHQAARRWVSAVNHWGRLGEWRFLVCRNPQSLDAGFAKLVDARMAREGPEQHVQFGGERIALGARPGRE